MDFWAAVFLGNRLIIIDTFLLLLGTLTECMKDWYYMEREGLVSQKNKVKLKSC